MPSLYIVATPIGNLDDITARARKVFSDVDAILAEDTRTSHVLLNHLGISKPTVAYHDYNKQRVMPRIMEELKNGKSYAVISDAGTPGIADPAFNLVREAVAAGVTVIPIPGPCAAIAALVASGLPTDRFVFDNFLPVKPGKRRARLQELAAETRTVVVYETPHRIVKALEDLHQVLPDVTVVIGRELTKVYEEFLRGTPRDLIARFAAKPPKGEMVLLFNPRVRKGMNAGAEAMEEQEPDGEHHLTRPSCGSERQEPGVEVRQ